MRASLLTLTLLILSAGTASAQQLTPQDVDALLHRCLDQDGNGSVTRAEYDRYFEHWDGPPSFGSYDEGGDGALSGGEFEDLVIDLVYQAMTECDSNHSAALERGDEIRYCFNAFVN